MVHFFMAMSRLSVVFLQFRGSEPSFNARERETCHVRTPSGGSPWKNELVLVAGAGPVFCAVFTEPEALRVDLSDGGIVRCDFASLFLCVCRHSWPLTCK